MAVLVTGGSGYIGVHVCVELLNAGYDIVAFDNFVNSKPEAVNRIRQVSGKEFKFYSADMTNKEELESIFRENNIEAVVHLAGLKAVGESIGDPLRYYSNNIGGTLTLLETMDKYGVHNLVFSSSATVYGTQSGVPIAEDTTLRATNPYGWTKLMVEDILRDLQVSNPEWGIVILRYFNPVGAHESGLMGEDPSGVPSNLSPFISQVAVGRLQELLVFGSDYPTPDGTGIRDYIHIVDLANGHLRAIEKVLQEPGIDVFNLGTGNGCSVLELIRAFEQVSGKSIPYKLVGRRPGDVAISFADSSKAQKVLGWRAERSILQMCQDTLRWQINNPQGYMTLASLHS
ncbi:UDP-glucose 4-epimerase GalE [Paenibacillus albus]|uniref:UDP-glucose 4-epimerase n=1 Tax=Paenibacillus albus TaxID=2495582 RepID=A0A3Q8X919_9BACL|nr:UDP-glucose 4-epimerase GalE [Paenibacillus albus]AZN43314.1 UDP-glucose 4-epimerase GalE [Paenibacillus albus]